LQFPKTGYNAVSFPKKLKQTGYYHDGTAPEPPAGLGCAGVRLWNAVHSEYEIADEPSGSAECLRMYRPRRGCKAEVLLDGMTVQSKTGMSFIERLRAARLNIKPSHPWTAWALRVISHARNNQAAFGAKRTSDGRQHRLARSKMTTHLRHGQFGIFTAQFDR
jgi:hypothetical protein